MLSRQPAPNILALRDSRRTILLWLAELAVTLLRGVRSRIDAAGGAPAGAGLAEFLRIGRWARVAVFAAFRIGQGALDEPRSLRPRRAACDTDERDSDDLETNRFEFDRPDTERLDTERLDERERFEHYLDLPFGQLVARICRGLGVKPDWDAWAGQPWAQAEQTWPPTLPSPQPRKPPSRLRGRRAAPPGEPDRNRPRRPPMAFPPPHRGEASRLAPLAQPPTAPPALNRKARRAREALARTSPRHA